MTTDRDALADVGNAVRRALTARTSDPHLIDDLTQETLLRLARSDRRLSPDEQRAYAVVTARNLLASHFRAESVRRRHQHRLVEHDGATDPEQRTIENEENAALAAALTRLDPGERDLLLRHEVSGTDLATLAGESDVSRGAIAMRLARARANLRLEFLLVFRRLSLPSPQCRPVLLALAVGDRRRQAQLDTVGHVESCPTCAALLGPMTERDRRVAAWLVVPLGDLLRRVRPAFRSWWVRVATVAMLLAALVGVVVIVDDPRGTDDSAGAPDVPSAAPATRRPVGSPAPAATAAPTPATAPPPPPPPPPPSPVPTTATPAAPVAPPPPAPPSTAAVLAPTPAVTAGEAPACPEPAPLTELDVLAAIGCPFAVSVVAVVAVPSSTTLEATVGQWSVEISLADGATVPLTLVPGVEISIAGTVDDASDGRVAVTVGDIGLAG